MADAGMGMTMVISEKGTDRLCAKRRHQKRTGVASPNLIGVIRSTLRTLAKAAEQGAEGGCEVGVESVKRARP